MPMIDVYAGAAVFDDKKKLARRLAAAVMAVEEVPQIPMFRQNTAAFVHELLPTDAISNVEGGSNYVRVQVLTNAGVLNRNKQIALVTRLTQLIASTPGAPPPPERIPVLPVDGGWRLWEHAHTNTELVQTARSQLAQTVETSTAAEA